jgi:hypothetical protein
MNLPLQTELNSIIFTYNESEEPCDFPKDFDVNDYILFKGIPTRVLKDNDTIELGGRTIQVCILPDIHRDICAFLKKIRAIYIPEI